MTMFEKCGDEFRHTRGVYNDNVPVSTGEEQAGKYIMLR